MQVNLNLTPAGVAELGESLYLAGIVLFRGIKIGVYESPPFAIPEPIEVPGILLAPVSEARFLDGSWCISGVLPGHTSGFEMVGQRHDQVNLAVRSPASQPLPCIAGQAFGGIVQLSHRLAVTRRFDYF